MHECMSSEDVDDGKVQVARNNLRIKLGDLVHVQELQNVEYRERIHVLPFDDSVEGLSGNIFDVHIKPYFLEARRPVSKGVHALRTIQ